MRMIGATAPLLLALLVHAVSGEIYYVSSSAGDDTAAGTSLSAPWRTLAKVCLRVSVCLSVCLPACLPNCLRVCRRRR